MRDTLWTNFRLITMSEQTVQLGNSFQKYFEIIIAKNEALKNESYHIRHQVYCEEFHYESVNDDKREIDEYDTSAIHLLLRSNKTGKFIGCARVILPQLNNLGNLLPIERICAFDCTRIDLTQLSRSKIAEVSRLAVVADYRRRKGDIKKPIGISDADFDIAKEQRFPYIPVSLYLGAIRIAQIYKAEYLFVLTEERLAAHFRRLGSDILIIGKPVDHRGVRIPSLINIQNTLYKMKPSMHSLYQIIAKEIG